MAMQTIYAALNGQEIRQATKTQLNKIIDNLPLLKLGNTFHKARVKFGFVMTAYPAEVETPQTEFEFEMIDEDLDPSTWKERSLKVDEVRIKLEQLEGKKNSLEEVIEAAKSFLAKLETEIEGFAELDGTIPDEVRIQSNMPIPVATTTPSGKRIEQFVESKVLFGGK